MESGAAAPHSKTWAAASTSNSRLRFGMRRCSGALDLLAYGENRIRWPSFHLYKSVSAKGAAFIVSLGHRPRKTIDAGHQR